MDAQARAVRDPLMVPLATEGYRWMLGMYRRQETEAKGLSAVGLHRHEAG